MDDEMWGRLADDGLTCFLKPKQFLQLDDLCFYMQAATVSVLLAPDYSAGRPSTYLAGGLAVLADGCTVGTRHQHPGPLSAALASSRHEYEHFDSLNSTSRPSRLGFSSKPDVKSLSLLKS